MKELTRKEFYKQMLSDLQTDYFMGLHQINTEQYNQLESNKVHFSLPKLSTSNPTYQEIIENIFKYGLNVPYENTNYTVKGFGNLKNLNKGFFDYHFYFN